ncbi:hypothetical protein ACPFUL_003623 [Vibrio cholerae]
MAANFTAFGVGRVFA